MNDRNQTTGVAQLLPIAEATQAEMAVILQKLQEEMEARLLAEQELSLIRQKLEENIRKESEKHRESARKYERLIEETKDLIAHLDKKGRVTFINRAAQALFDLEPKDYYGASIIRFIHPDDRKSIKAWWHKCIAERIGRTSIELRQVGAGSKEVYFLQWSASFHYDETGRLTGVGAIGRDVSEIRRAEENYRDLFSKMLNGFALHEIICREGRPVDYRFLSVNPAFEALTGQKAENLIGKTVLEVLPDTEPFWIETYGQVSLTGRPISFERYAASVDRYFEVAAYCPAPGRFACIFQDITPRKKADLEKALLEKQLRRRHKMEAIGTLAGGIAHDFNNILAAILGYTDMAMEDLPPWSLARSHLHEVIKAGNRAKELVKQILAFSRREEQHREPVSLSSLIREVVVFLRSTIPTTIDILLDLDPNCGPILADQTQIHQVLMNICTNAAQAMEAEGGTLSLCLREVTPSEEELDQTGGRLPAALLVRLDIGDTGPGIDEEYLDRIFDPYFTTKEFGSGTGMGLAVAHGIVKNHDGVIRVAKNQPKGACFSLFFPRTEEQVRPAAVVETEYGPGKERLLLIDDDPSIARMLKIFLDKQGYTTTILNSSRKALEIFRAKPQAFDLVVTDQTMPDMTGEELAIKILEVRKDIPIILCTGYSTMIDELKARCQGIKAFHMKPVALKDLAATVRRLLDDVSEARNQKPEDSL